MRRVAVLSLVASLALTGCFSRPGRPAYSVVVEFSDVLDLVPRSAVKVNDVTVGSVEKVWLSGWTARVRARVGGDVKLPDNATAAVRQTSLLGEKFVALSAPVGEPATGELSDGDVIPLSRTKRTAEVEEVLGALGLLLNGGGLAHLKTINQELANAFEGREGAAKDALHQLDAFIAGLDTQKADIVRAIDALDRLSARLAAQRATIGAAVDALAPGLRVLAEQRAQLTAALTALGDLGTVGTRVVTASRNDTVATVQALRPILDQLVKAGDALPKALDFLLSYPFPPNITRAIVGNQVNLRVTADLDVASVLANLLAAAPPASTPPPAGSNPGGPPAPGGLPGVPGLPGLPSLPPLPLPSLSASPSLPPLPLPSLSLSPPPLPIVDGAAPLGASEGTRGGLVELLTGGGR